MPFLREVGLVGGGPGESLLRHANLVVWLDTLLGGLGASAVLSVVLEDAVIRASGGTARRVPFGHDAPRTGRGARPPMQARERQRR